MIIRSSRAARRSRTVLTSKTVLTSRTVLTAVATFAMVGTSCGAITGSDSSTASAVPVQQATGSPEQLCAAAAEFAGPLTTAADLAVLADTKVAYLTAARAAAPAEWVDNIDIIIPAWETLVEVIAAADGDPSRIDFDKFRADFADATANDAALDAYVASRCTG